MTVAVGLVYDAKARFRSRALVRVGRARGGGAVGRGLPARRAGHGARRHRRPGSAALPGQPHVLLVDAGRSSSPGSPRWSSARPAEPGSRRRRTGRPGRGGGAPGGRAGRVPAASGTFRCLRRPTSGTSTCSGVNDAQLAAGRPPAPAAPRGPVVGAEGRRRRAVRRRRRGGARRPVPDHEAGGEAADQRGDQGHGEAARVASCCSRSPMWWWGCSSAGPTAPGPAWRGRGGAAVRLRGGAAGRAGEADRGLVEGYRMLRGRREVVRLGAGAPGRGRGDAAASSLLMSPRRSATAATAARWPRCGGPTGRGDRCPSSC